MDLPITRPSRMSYADELNINELLGELKSKRFNGFIRLTSGSSEGHILFNGGKHAAASFDNYLKIEAVEKIKAASNESNALIEVFDLKESQIKYIMDINKAYLIDSKVNDILDELKRPEPNTKIEKKSSNRIEPEIKETVETPDIPKPEIKEATEIKPEEVTENINDTTELASEIKTEPEIVEEIQQEINDKAEEISPEIKESENPESPPIVEKKDTSISTEEAKAKQFEEEIELIEVDEAETADRSELMKKYGLKDVGEEEVENILETYKGGSLSDEDVEKIELTLMNKIKKSVLGIPKIRGTEVMVFLDNIGELSGTINIITEYESKGFLSRIMGESKDIEDLRRQIFNITQIEIKKSFRGYPEIVDAFEINVEVS